jgi:hypothetical protein
MNRGEADISIVKVQFVGYDNHVCWHFLKWGILDLVECWEFELPLIVPLVYSQIRISITVLSCCDL